MGMLLGTEVKCVERPTAMLINCLSTQKMVVLRNMSFRNGPREGTGIDWKWQMTGAEGIAGKVRTVQGEIFWCIGMFGRLLWEVVNCSGRCSHRIQVYCYTYSLMCDLTHTHVYANLNSYNCTLQESSEINCQNSRRGRTAPLSKQIKISYNSKFC